MKMGMVFLGLYAVSRIKLTILVRSSPSAGNIEPSATLSRKSLGENNSTSYLRKRASTPLCLSVKECVVMKSTKPSKSADQNLMSVYLESGLFEFLSL